MVKVETIEKITYRGWLYGIEVDEDHSFVANGIVVHNCEEGVNQEAKLEIINKSKGGVRKQLTYNSIPLIKRRVVKHQTDEGHLHAPDFEPDVEKAPDLVDESHLEGSEVQDMGYIKSASTEADLMSYFTLFKSLFVSHHDIGGLDIVLFDSKTGEVLLPDE